MFAVLAGFSLHPLPSQITMIITALRVITTWIVVTIIVAHHTKTSLPCASPVRTIRLHVCATHDLPQQNHILSPHDEYSSRDVSKLLPHVDPLDRLVEHQVGWRTKRGERVQGVRSVRGWDFNVSGSIQRSPTELIDAPEVPDQCSAISEQHQVLL